MRLTGKQIIILNVIIAGNSDDGVWTPCDLDQLIERLSYHPTKHSIHFSIRKLIAKDMIFKSGMERRRERRRVLISPTKKAIEYFRSKDNDSFIEANEDF
jgi:DNA-binding MarR family transcriptional regulator